MGRRSFDDVSISTKVVSTIIVAVTVAVAVGVVGLLRLADASQSAKTIYAGNVSSIKAVGMLKSALYQTRLSVINQAIAPTSAGVERYTKAFEEDAREFVAAMAAYRASNPAGDTAMIDGFERDWEAYTAVTRSQMLPAGARHDLTAWQAIREKQIAPITTRFEQYLTELDKAETADAAKNAAAAATAYRTGRIVTTAVMIAGSVLALLLGVLVARRIVRSLLRVQAVCDALAAGDLTRQSGVTSRDEPGRMARSLDAAIANLRDTVGTIDSSSASLAQAAGRLSSATTQIAGSAQSGSSEAVAVSAAAEQVSRSVDSVSAGGEQMGAAIREISQNAAEAAQVAAEAVGLAASTSTTMSKLGDSSAEIGNVIKTITAIAEQTNLLALNATIEAARAGEAGKGFAVVASEVKDLAQETARATEDISQRVQAIQADTGGAVTAIDEISRVITRISDYQTTIASAVEQQTATTGEMNRSVTDAATGSNDIAQRITAVAQAAEATSRGAAESQQATADLARMSGDLSALVDRFRYREPTT